MKTITLYHDGDYHAPFFKLNPRECGDYICHEALEQHFEELPGHARCIHLCFSKSVPKRAKGNEFDLIEGYPYVEACFGSGTNAAYALSYDVTGWLKSAYDEGYRYVWIEYEDGSSIAQDEYERVQL